MPLPIFAIELDELRPKLDIDSFQALSGDARANTKFALWYTDAFNFSKSVDVVLKGELSASALQTIIEHFEDIDQFLPEQVGLPRLSPRSIDEGYDDECDHGLHHFRDIQLTLREATIDLGCSELAANFKKASNAGWDYDKYC